MRTEILRKKHKAGTTLVELVVSMLLFSMISLIVIGVLSPAAKMFVRMQRIQFARIILDNTIDELRGIVQEAAGYVKIYENGAETSDIIGVDGDGMQGTCEGPALEFLNSQGYVVLVSAQGCGETAIVRGGKLTEQKIEAQGGGRLLTRYYAQERHENGLYLYADAGGNPLVARAVSSVFTDGYYMGNYLKITFSFQDGAGNVIDVDEGVSVDYLVADVGLYRDEACRDEDLVVQDRVILDFKYSVQCRKGITGKNADNALDKWTSTGE